MDLYFYDLESCSQMTPQEMWVRSLGQDSLLEEEMATHSSILAWVRPESNLQNSENIRAETKPEQKMFFILNLN